MQRIGRRCKTCKHHFDEQNWKHLVLMEFPGAWVRMLLRKMRMKLMKSLGKLTWVNLQRSKKKLEKKLLKDLESDDDEFYDQTQKLPKHQSGENKSVVTADTLLDKEGRPH